MTLPQSAADRRRCMHVDAQWCCLKLSCASGLNRHTELNVRYCFIVI